LWPWLRHQCKSETCWCHVRLYEVKNVAGMKSALVIGGGFGGCTAVHELSKKGWEITLVEPSEELGGGVRTRFRSGHPHTIGPRHFLTQDEDTFRYLSRHLEMRLCKEHQFISFVNDDSNFYSYPIHFDDIQKMPESQKIYNELELLEDGYKHAQFNLTTGSPELENRSKDYEDFWVRSVGRTLYAKFIREYSKKMWMVDDNRVIDDFSWSPKGVAIKRGSREGWDTAISAYPKAIDGYNAFFDSALEKCTRIKECVEEVRPGLLSARIGRDWYNFDLIINTAPLDDLFNESQGSLKYIGRKVEFVVLPVEFALPENVYFAYYTGLEPYTRVVEYKKFTQFKSPHTLISLEYPQLDSGKYYPMPSEQYRKVHREYLELCHPLFLNAGRIALYNYRYDIDDVILQVRDHVGSL